MAKDERSGQWAKVAVLFEDGSFELYYCEVAQFDRWEPPRRVNPFDVGVVDRRTYIGLRGDLRHFPKDITAAAEARVGDLFEEDQDDH